MSLLNSLINLKASIIKATAKAESIAIITHRNPDGDGLCCALALQELINKNPHLNRGVLRTIDVVLEEKAPSLFDYVQAQQRTRIYNEQMIYQLIVVLDCHAVERVGRCAPLINTAHETIVIDHHEITQSETIINSPNTYIDTSYASTGAIAFAMFKQDIEGLDKPAKDYVLTNLYVTLLNDTNIFTNSNTDSKVLSMSAEMVSLGVDPSKTVKQYIPPRTPAYYRFLGQCLATIKTYKDDQVLLFYSNNKMLQENGLDSDATTKMTENLKGLTEDVRVVIYAREIEHKRYKLSLRSEEIDVNKVATALGGGGHKKASGCEVEGSVDQIREKVLVLIDKQL